MEPEILDYLKNIRLQVGATTYRRKVWQIQAYFKWLGKQRKHWASVEQRDISAYLYSLKCSHAVRKQMLQLIRDFYKFQGVKENPASGIVFKRDASRRLPAVPNKLSIDELLVSLSDRKNRYATRDRLIVELAYGSGLRRDELRKVNIEDVDLEEQILYVHGKGGRVRKVPLTTKTAELIREYVAERRVSRGPLLVSYAGKRLSLNGVYSVLKLRAGIRPHLLRHACAGHMLQNGAGIKIIQEMLGHKDLKSTTIYTQINKETLREVINRNHPRKD